MSNGFDPQPRPRGSASAVPATMAARVHEAARWYEIGEQRVLALDRLSVAFRRGEFTAVMGPSGSGKSTLLQCAAGLDRLDAGEAFIGETALGPLSEKERTVLRRTSVGFVFQDYNLVDSLTAIQNLELPVRLMGLRPDRAATLASLHRVGLADRTRHLPDQLSGGQRQRVAIARALAIRPEVVFADEPTGALDTQGSQAVLRLLRGVVDQEGLTVVMVTHDPSAAAFADRVIYLQDGRLVDDVGRHAAGVGSPQAAAGIATRMAELGA